MLVDIDIEAMAFNHQFDLLIGASGDQGQAAKLVTLDADNGTVTSTIALTYKGAPVHDEVVGLAFHPVSGTLYGWAEREGLFAIDPVTGIMSLVIAENWDAQDIAWAPSGGELYLVGGTELRSWTPGDTELTLIGDGLPDDAEALDVLSDGTLVISAEPGGVTQLVHVDPTLPAIISTLSPDPAAFYDDMEAVVVMGDCNPFAPGTPTPLVTGTPVPTETPTPTSTPTPSPTTTPLPTPCGVFVVAALGGRDVQLLHAEVPGGTLTPLGPIHNNHDLESLQFDAIGGRLLSVREVGHDYTLAAYSAIDGAFLESKLLVRADGTAWPNEFEGLTTDPATGLLWGWSKGSGLATIDPATGEVTLQYASSKDINALAYSPLEDRFYLVEGDTLWTMDSPFNTLVQAANDLPGETEGLFIDADGALFGATQTSTGIDFIRFDSTGAVLWSQSFSTSYDDWEGLTIAPACSPLSSLLPTSTPTLTPTQTPTATPTPTVTPTPSIPSSFFGVNALGSRDVQFVTIDTQSGIISNLGPVHNNHDLESLLYDQQSHELLSIRRISHQEYALARYGASSGTFVGETTLIDAAGDRWGDEVEGLTRVPGTGVIWGWSKGRGLVEIDIATGETEVVFSSSKDINAAAFRPSDGRFFLTRDEQLWYLDPSASTLQRASFDLPGPTEALGTTAADGILGMAQVSNGLELMSIADDGTTDWSIPFAGYDLDIEGLAVSSGVSPTVTPTPTVPPPPGAPQQHATTGRFIAVPDVLVLERRVPGALDHTGDGMLLGELLVSWLTAEHTPPVASRVVHGDITTSEFGEIDLLVWEASRPPDAAIASTLARLLSEGTSVLAVVPGGPKDVFLVMDDSGVVFTVPIAVTEALGSSSKRGFLDKGQQP